LLHTCQRPPHSGLGPWAQRGAARQPAPSRSTATAAARARPLQHSPGTAPQRPARSPRRKPAPPSMAARMGRSPPCQHADVGGTPSERACRCCARRRCTTSCGDRRRHPSRSARGLHSACQHRAGARHLVPAILCAHRRPASAHEQVLAISCRGGTCSRVLGCSPACAPLHSSSSAQMRPGCCCPRSRRCVRTTRAPRLCLCLPQNPRPPPALRTPPSPCARCCAPSQPRSSCSWPWRRARTARGVRSLPARCDREARNAHAGGSARVRGHCPAGCP
jgi:hypothetical protein